MRPLKFRLVAEIPTSPSFRRPVPSPKFAKELLLYVKCYDRDIHSPIHGPQPAGNTFAPASTNTFQSPLASASFCISLLAAAI